MLELAGSRVAVLPRNDEHAKGGGEYMSYRAAYNSASVRFAACMADHEACRCGP